MYKVSYKKYVVAITLFTLISKAFGFIRESVVAYYFGTSLYVDIYVISITIPTLFLGFLSCASPAFISQYNEIRHHKNKETSNAFFVHFFLAISVAAICLILVLRSFDTQIIHFLAPGFNSEQIHIAREYLAIVIWDAVLVAGIDVTVAFLQVNDKFIQASSSIVVHSSFQIIFAAMAGKYGAILLAYGYIISDLLYLLVLIGFAQKDLHVTRSSLLNFDGKIIIQSCALAFPLFLVNILDQAITYIDRSLASVLAIGSISSLYYAGIVKNFAITTLDVGITSVALPVLSKMVSGGNLNLANRSFEKSLLFVATLFIPTALGIALLSSNVITILFGRGSFDETSIKSCSTLLALYAIGMIAVGIEDISKKYVFSTNRNSRCTLITLVKVGIYYLLSSLLIKKYKVFALAISFSLSSWLIIPFYYIVIKKATSWKPSWQFIKAILKISAAAISMFLIILLFNLVIAFESKYLVFVIDVTLGMISYFVILYNLKVEEINEFFRSTKNRLLEFL